MNSKFAELRSKVAETKRIAENAELNLELAERSCQHKWGDPERADIYEAGYEIPGDPPGTMGVDWRGPTYVPTKTTKRWKRTCTTCGKVEFTTNTTVAEVHSPKF